MGINIYRNEGANSVFIEDANGAQFTNSLRAILSDTNSSGCSIVDLVRDIELISDITYTGIVDENDDTYGNNRDEVCNALNAIFENVGTSTPSAPDLSSVPTGVDVVAGDPVNFIINSALVTATEFSYSGLPNTTTDSLFVSNSYRGQLQGELNTAGIYDVGLYAWNGFGTSNKTVKFIVSNPPFINTRSIAFNNQQYLTGTASAFSSVLANNGAGSSDAWSIGFWFKPGTSSGNQQVIIYYGGDDTDNEGGITLIWRGNNNKRHLRLQYGSNNNNLVLDTPNGSISYNTWTHVLVTYDGGTTGAASGSISDYYSRFKIFIDGSEQTTTNSNSNYGITSDLATDRFRIGYGEGSQFLKSAKVEELAVWDADISSNISDIYNGGTTFDLTTESNTNGNLVSFWRMGDGDTYPTITDNEGSNNLTMTNMTTNNIVNDVP